MWRTFFVFLILNQPFVACITSAVMRHLHPLYVIRIILLIKFLRHQLAMKESIYNFLSMCCIVLFGFSIKVMPVPLEKKLLFSGILCVKFYFWNV